LRTVAHLWRIEQRNINGLEFARVAAQLHDNFAALIEGIQDVGVKLDRARDAHSGLIRRLTEGGRGSVLLKVQQLKELGAPAKKNLPRELLERSGGGNDMPGSVADDETIQVVEEPAVEMYAAELGASELPASNVPASNTPAPNTLFVEIPSLSREET